MEIKETVIEGCFEVKHKVHGDDRGYFFEAFNEKKMEICGDKFDVKQVNFASSNKGIIRGLHYQLQPYSQTKLVGVLQGVVIDVVVDLRKNSKTYMEVFKIEINSKETGLIVPKGLAHGYQVMEDNTIFYYAVDQFYSPDHERGVNFMDPELSIDIKTEKPEQSEKDKNLPYLAFAEHNF